MVYSPTFGHVEIDGEKVEYKKEKLLQVRQKVGIVFQDPNDQLFAPTVKEDYEKEAPNTLIPASNVAPSGWDEFLAGDDTLLCALDRVFDKASVFMMRGPSFRGRGLDTFSVEALPQATRQRGAQPTMP